jgi:hypothetical protein
MRRLLAAGNVIAAADVLFMPDYGGCRFYDKAERDRHHALRRIKRQRARSIASWAMLPWLIAAAVLLVFFCVGSLTIPVAMMVITVRVVSVMAPAVMVVAAMIVAVPPASSFASVQISAVPRKNAISVATKIFMGITSHKWGTSRYSSFSVLSEPKLIPKHRVVGSKPTLDQAGLSPLQR